MKVSCQRLNRSSNLTVVESSSRTRSSTPQLGSLLAAISAYKVLLVGDAILDEYVYVKPLGMSAKEAIIVGQYQRTETFRGGVWAAESHVENFCASTGIMRGDNIIIKRRFIEEQYVKKLFEVHETKNDPMGYKQMPLEYWDLVVVTDFGHGTVSPVLIKELTEKAKYLAVNAQTNSANRGFNLITKYPRADYVVIDEPEARLAAQDRYSPIEKVITKLGFPKMIVTQGAYGAVGFDGDFSYSEAKTNKVVDTMGAGDAFLCVTAPLAAAGADMQTLLKVGNAAGAIKCGVVGQTPVTKQALVRYLND